MPGWKLRLCLACHSPLLARVLVPVVLGQHDVQEDEVVMVSLQARHRGSHSWKHSSAIGKKEINILNICCVLMENIRASGKFSLY